MNYRRPLILSAVAWLVAAACSAGTFLTHRYRPVILSESRDAGFALGMRLDDGRAFVSWRPRDEYRPAWAGQVNRAGFRYTRWSNGAAEVGVPLWLPALAAATTAVVAEAVARSKQRRVLRGCCARCGYDLRATPGRCPECGEVGSVA